MAQTSKRCAENIAGDFFVDSSCIDCDTCRWMAPDVFTRAGEQSAVYKQPLDETQSLQAMQALISCPTASIGYLGKDINIKEVQETFPILIEDNVYHCGYHSEKSFAAASYFIKRDSGNVLIDSPRFTMPLVKELEALGGVKYIFFTHEDDIGDHQKYHEHFGAKRIIHRGDAEAIPNAEIIVEHDFHSKIDDAEDELVMIHVPGHTKGSMVLDYQKKFLFSGDHLAYSAERNQLIAWKNHCGYSWDKQIESMEKLIEYYWWWLLPGHGRRFHAHPEAFKVHVEKCVEWMKEFN